MQGDKQNHSVSGPKIGILLLICTIAMCWPSVGMAEIGLERIHVAPPSPGNPRNSEGDLIRLKDGSLFLAYSHFTGGSGDHDTADLVGRFSSDGGKTWTDPVIVVSNEAERNTICTWEKIKTIEEDPRYGYCYPAIEFLKNEDYAILSYTRWEYSPNTLGVQVTRIPLDWIYK